MNIQDKAIASEGVQSANIIGVKDHFAVPHPMWKIERFEGDINTFGPKYLRILSRVSKFFDARRKELFYAQAKLISESQALAQGIVGGPVTLVPGNIQVNAGINAMTTLLCGGGGTAFTNAAAYLGVGDSSTAASASQTDLQAASNKLRKAMNGGFPTYGTSQQAAWQSDFGSSDANFAWEEFAVFNASSGGTMLNRKCSSQGTKVSGQTWRLTLTITWS